MSSISTILGEVVGRSIVEHVSSTALTAIASNVRSIFRMGRQAQKFSVMDGQRRTNTLPFTTTDRARDVARSRLSVQGESQDDFIDRLKSEVDSILQDQFVAELQSDGTDHEILICSRWQPHREVLKLVISKNTKMIKVLKPNVVSGVNRSTVYENIGAFRPEPGSQMSLMYKAVRQYLIGLAPETFIPYNQGVRLREV